MFNISKNSLRQFNLLTQDVFTPEHLVLPDKLDPIGASSFPGMSLQRAEGHLAIAGGQCQTISA